MMMTAVREGRDFGAVEEQGGERKPRVSHKMLHNTALLATNCPLTRDNDEGADGGGGGG